MFEQLKGIENHFDELSQRLCDPSVVGDPDRKSVV